MTPEKFVERKYLTSTVQQYIPKEEVYRLMEDYAKSKMQKGIMATYKFYAVENAPYVGAYRVGSFNDGEPQIMFAMDFHTWTLRDMDKNELTDAFKDGILQTLTHEFCHSMQEMLDKDYDELEVEKILGAYKPTWNVFDAPQEEEPAETVFKISDLLQWMDGNNANTADEFKEQLNQLFMAHRLWIEAKKENDSK